jgi:hypothetical protein
MIAFLVVLLASIALAAAIPQNRGASPSKTASSKMPVTSNVAFHAAALAPSFLRSPPHKMLHLTASGLEIFVNGTTASYCPDQVGISCPPGNDTSFIGGITSPGLSMNVEVPGGQLVYVTPEGRVKYTQAHSASLDPPNSYTTGFSIDQSKRTARLIFSEPDPQGNFDKARSANFYACEPIEPWAPAGSWAVWAETKKFVFNDTCLAIAVYANLKTPVSGPEAWQYT